MKTPDIGRLETALAEYEKFGTVDTAAIDQAKAVLDLLRALKEDSDVTRLEKALCRVQGLKVNVIAHVQKASNRLVFQYEKRMFAFCFFGNTILSLNKEKKCTTFCRF